MKVRTTAGFEGMLVLQRMTTFQFSATGNLGCYGYCSVQWLASFIASMNAVIHGWRCHRPSCIPNVYFAVRRFLLYRVVPLRTLETNGLIAVVMESFRRRLRRILLRNKNSKHLGLFDVSDVTHHNTCLIKQKSSWEVTHSCLTRPSPFVLGIMSTYSRKFGCFCPPRTHRTPCLRSWSS